MLVALVGVLVTVAMLSVIAARGQDSLPYVGDDGQIRLPKDFRSWSFLGTWVVAKDDRVMGFHDVYTQQDTVEAYRKTGRFPDGAVLVKELRKVEAGPMTTGQVNWAGDVEGWFVMIRDADGRFPGHPLWGDGWGWALFNAQADGSHKLSTTSYKAECIPCHAPAQQTDWVYVRGYPVLRERADP